MSGDSNAGSSRKLLSKRQRLARWIAMLVSLPVGGYLETYGVYYSWLGAADRSLWPAGKAETLRDVAFVLSAVAFLVFAYCVASLLRDANRRSRGGPSS